MQQNRYKLSQYAELEVQKKAGRIVPLVYTKLPYGILQEQLACYDLILEMRESANQFKFVLEGNNQLSTTKVKEFANAYVKLIKIFLQQYNL
jgi:hypothetical protein